MKRARAQNSALDEEEDAALTMMIFVLSFRKGHTERSGHVISLVRLLSRSICLKNIFG